MSKSLQITQQTRWVIQGLEDSYSLIPSGSLPTEKHSSGTYEAYDAMAGRSEKKLIDRWANAAHSEVCSLIQVQVVWLNSMKCVWSVASRVTVLAESCQNFSKFWCVTCPRIDFVSQLSFGVSYFSASTTLRNKIYWMWPIMWTSDLFRVYSVSCPITAEIRWSPLILNRINVDMESKWSNK